MFKGTHDDDDEESAETLRRLAALINDGWSVTFANGLLSVFHSRYGSHIIYQISRYSSLQHAIDAAWAGEPPARS